MGRLIDADEFMRIVTREYPGENRIDIKNLIDMTPTAYDTDKVVEELEVAREDYTENDDIVYGLRLAIEIVRGGKNG